MTVDLTRFKAAVATLLASIDDVEKRDHAHREAFIADGHLEAHERYYELRTASPASWADKDKWMADNYPDETERALKLEADVRAFRDEQQRLNDALPRQLEEVLVQLGVAFGDEAVAGLGDDEMPALDDIEQCFDRMNEILGSEMKTSRARVHPLMPGPCSNAFYGRLAPRLGIDIKSKSLVDLVRAELSPAAALRH